MAYTHSDLQGALTLLTSGKVRDLYEVDRSTLLFVATDRISAYDVIMENVSIFPTSQNNRKKLQSQLSIILFLRANTAPTLLH
jgi:phosphoribosylaminoimidazole-succinocarboxamide synthase